MKVKRKYSLFICFISILTIISSCSISVDHTREEGQFIVNLDSLPLNETMKFSSLFKQGEILAILDTASNAMLGRIDKLAIHGNKIVIMDQLVRRQILVFDLNGKLLYPIGRVGEAPGEYSEVSDFTYSIADDLLFVLDSRAKKILVYQLGTGAFIYSIGCNHFCLHIHYANERLYTDCPNLHRTSQNESLLVEIDKKTGEIIHTYINPQKYNQGFDKPLSNSGGPFLMSSNDVFRYSQIFSHTVFSASDDEVIPYFTLQSEQWICTKDLEGIDVDNDPQGMFKIIQKGKYFDISRYIESQEFIFCNIGKGFSKYYIYYNKKDGKTYFSSQLDEDLLFDSANFEFLKLEYGGSDNKGAYFYLSPSSSKILWEDYYDDIKFLSFRSLGENYNGAVFRYEFKK